MKTHILFKISAFVVLATVALAGPITPNPFANGIDKSVWAYDAGIYLDNGILQTVGRGVLATKQGMNGSNVVNGSFIMRDEAEHFNVVIRSDLSIREGLSELTGVIITFVNDGKGVSIQESANLTAWDLRTQVASTGAGGYQFITGQEYAFSITDDGQNIGVAIDGIDILTGISDFGTGSNIALYSREFGYGSCIPTLDIQETGPWSYQYYNTDTPGGYIKPLQIYTRNRGFSVPDTMPTIAGLFLGLGLLAFRRLK